MVIISLTLVDKSLSLANRQRQILPWTINMKPLKFTQLKKGNHLPSASTFWGFKMFIFQGGFLMFSPHLPSWISPKSRLHWTYHWKPYGYLPKGSNKHSRLSWRWRLAAIMKGKQPEDMRILFSHLCFFASRRHENCPFFKNWSWFAKKTWFSKSPNEDLWHLMTVDSTELLSCESKKPEKKML